MPVNSVWCHPLSLLFVTLSLVAGLKNGFTKVRMGQERGRKEEKLLALPFCSPLLSDTQITYIFAVYFTKATMRRLGPLRLMTSHTHLYAKLDEFGKDFNAVIKKRVSDECQFLNMHHQPPPYHLYFFGTGEPPAFLYH